MPVDLLQPGLRQGNVRRSVRLQRGKEALPLGKLGGEGGHQSRRERLGDGVVLLQVVVDLHGVVPQGLHDLPQGFGFVSPWGEEPRLGRLGPWSTRTLTCGAKSTQPAAVLPLLIMACFSRIIFISPVRSTVGAFSHATVHRHCLQRQARLQSDSVRFVAALHKCPTRNHVSVLRVVTRKATYQRPGPPHTRTLIHKPLLHVRETLLGGFHSHREPFQDIVYPLPIAIF